MGRRLTALVRGCSDLPLLDYVIENLPKNLPPKVISHKSQTYLQKPWLAALERKCELLGGPFVELTKYLKQEEFAHLQRERAVLLRDRAQALRELARQPRATLGQQLRDPEPAVRLETIAAVAMARSHLERELIERLNDKDADVRQAARRALVRLGRGTDFGPRSGASKRSRLKAQQRWLDWLALQDDRPKPGLASGQPEGRLMAADRAVARRIEDFLAAAPARRDELLTEWRDSKGGEYTDTLAQLIPQLPEALQTRVRPMLTERLTRMTADTLRAMLQDDDAEVRCAAASACGKKKGRAHIPDLLPLLEDEEPMVARVARGTLKTLSGEDFGPRPDAGRAERMLAIAAWRAWWAKEKSKDR